jgi:hypothetical protein
MFASLPNWERGPNQSVVVEAIRRIINANFEGVSGLALEGAGFALITELSPI